MFAPNLSQFPIYDNFGYQQGSQIQGYGPPFTTNNSLQPPNTSYGSNYNLLSPGRSSVQATDSVSNLGMGNLGLGSQSGSKTNPNRLSKRKSYIETLKVILAGMEPSNLNRGIVVRVIEKLEHPSRESSPVKDLSKIISRVPTDDPDQQQLLEELKAYLKRKSQHSVWQKAPSETPERTQPESGFALEAPAKDVVYPSIERSQGTFRSHNLGSSAGKRKKQNTVVSSPSSSGGEVLSENESVSSAGKKAKRIRNTLAKRRERDRKRSRLAELEAENARLKSGQNPNELIGTTLNTSSPRPSHSQASTPLSSPPSEELSGNEERQSTPPKRKRKRYIKCSINQSKKRADFYQTQKNLIESGAPWWTDMHAVKHRRDSPIVHEKVRGNGIYSEITGTYGEPDEYGLKRHKYSKKPSLSATKKLLKTNERHQRSPRRPDQAPIDYREGSAFSQSASGEESEFQIEGVSESDLQTSQSKRKATGMHNKHTSYDICVEWAEKPEQAKYKTNKELADAFNIAFPKAQQVASRAHIYHWLRKGEVTGRWEKRPPRNHNRSKTDKPRASTPTYSRPYDKIRADFCKQQQALQESGSAWADIRDPKNKRHRGDSPNEVTTKVRREKGYKYMKRVGKPDPDGLYRHEYSKYPFSDQPN
jgi:hypothetical protein